MTGPLPTIVLISLCGLMAEAVALRLLLTRRPRTLIVANYRGVPVVGRAGLTFLAPLVIGVLVAIILHHGLQFRGLGLFAAAVATSLFGLLGWVDDSRGGDEVRGLQGHLRALVNEGRVTTGLVKAVGGALIGLWAASLLGAPGWTVLLAGAVIALSANGVNALDARPGRATLAFAFVAVVVLALGSAAPLSGPLVLLAALAGGALAFALPDMAERVMLGDTGANPLGCALGLAVVSVTSWPTWVVLALLLLALTWAADRWSLSGLIESLLSRRVAGVETSADESSNGRDGD